MFVLLINVDALEVCVLTYYVANNIDVREWIQALQPYGYRVVDFAILEDVFRANLPLLDTSNSSWRLRWTGVTLCSSGHGQRCRGRHGCVRRDATFEATYLQSIKSLLTEERTLREKKITHKQQTTKKKSSLCILAFRFLNKFEL